MKLPIILLSIVSIHLLGTGILWAEPGDLACRGALVKVTRAQDTVQAIEREVQQAKSTTKVAFAVLEVCNLGTIADGKTIRDCVTHRAEVPRQVRDLVQVETELQEVIHEFQTVFEQMSRVCLDSPSHHISTGGLVYP